MQLALREQSDSLYTPYSSGLLGWFSPYLGVPFPPDLQCYECGTHQQHYAAEYPARLARVCGEPPPDWAMDQLGAVVKDSAAWNGPDLTDAARAKYRDFQGRAAQKGRACWRCAGGGGPQDRHVGIRRPRPGAGALRVEEHGRGAPSAQATRSSSGSQPSNT
jgi:hypothetical protein